MSELLVINVTAKHLKKGLQGARCACPLALAVEEKVGRRCSVMGDGFVVVANLNGYWGPRSKYYTGGKEFVEGFDNAKRKAKPTQIVLRSITKKEVEIYVKVEAALKQ